MNYALLQSVSLTPALLIYPVKYLKMTHLANSGNGPVKQIFS
jgi:hypothetical protein